MYWPIQHLWAPLTKVRTDFFLLKWMNLKQRDQLHFSYLDSQTVWLGLHFGTKGQALVKNYQANRWSLHCDYWAFRLLRDKGQLFEIFFGSRPLGRALRQFLLSGSAASSPAAWWALSAACLGCSPVTRLSSGFLRTYVGVADINTTAAFLPGWILPSRSLDNIVTLAFVGFDSTSTCRQHRVVAARIHI